MIGIILILLILLYIRYLYKLRDITREDLGDDKCSFGKCETLNCCEAKYGKCDTTRLTESFTASCVQNAKCLECKKGCQKRKNANTPYFACNSNHKCAKCCEDLGVIKNAMNPPPLPPPPTIPTFDLNMPNMTAAKNALANFDTTILDVAKGEVLDVVEELVPINKITPIFEYIENFASNNFDKFCEFVEDSELGFIIKGCPEIAAAAETAASAMNNNNSNNNNNNNSNNCKKQCKSKPSSSRKKCIRKCP